MPRQRFHQTRQLFRDQGHLLILIILITIVFFAQILIGERWYARFMVVPAEIMTHFESLQSGSFASEHLSGLKSLITYAFLHAGFDHIIYNMIFLWIFAALINELLGWRWMLTIFVLTSIAGGLTHVAMNRTDFIPMLGASGAVMGFEGAYLGLATRFALPDPHVWPIARPIPPGRLALLAVLGVSFDYYAILEGSDVGIAYGAHIGGFTMGLLITALAVPRPKLARTSR